MIKKTFALVLTASLAFSCLFASGVSAAGTTKQIDDETKLYTNDFSGDMSAILSDPSLGWTQPENFTLNDGKLTTANDNWAAVGSGAMLGPLSWKGYADIRVGQSRDTGDRNQSVMMGVRVEYITNLHIDTGLWFAVGKKYIDVFVAQNNARVQIDIPVDFSTERRIYLEDKGNQIIVSAADGDATVTLVRVDFKDGNTLRVSDGAGNVKGRIPNHNLPAMGYFRFVPMFCEASIDNYSYELKERVKNQVTDAYAITDAGEFSKQEGAGMEPTTDPKKDGGYDLTAREGSFAVYEKLDFGAGGNKTAGFKFRLNKVVWGSRTITLRLDGPQGRIIGVVSFSTTQKNQWEEQWGAVEPVSGVHDLYLSFTGAASFSSFQFTKDSPFDEKNLTYVPIDDSKIVDNFADTWVATDMLGRKILTGGDEGVPQPRKDKEVGIFYWTWADASGGQTPVNITHLFRQYPEAEYNNAHPAWPGPGATANYWSEPLYGFYRSSDPYVIRKHAELLAAAGVDYVLTDCTNGSWLWNDGLIPLFEGFRQAKEQGVNVPKIALMLNFGAIENSGHMLRAAYTQIYKLGLYKDLWYMVDGKPLIMAFSESVPNGESDFDKALMAEIRGFFTFRAGQGSCLTGPTREDHWGWLEVAPQHGFGKLSGGGFEMATVGVAQNINKSKGLTDMNDDNDPVFGRSYTTKDGHSKTTEGSFVYGYNVQEQWDNAIKLDPQRIFITGWNEWTALRQADATPGKVRFTDQFSPEKSRDIEMDKEYIKDVYYLQMVSNIRRFKGARACPVATGEKTISGKSFADWQNVGPEFIDHAGTAVNRDYPGLGKITYKNTTARNDIVAAKVARDSENLYFYAKTQAGLTPQDGSRWMNLYINTDRNAGTGWEGYDFVINREKAGSVEKCLPDGTFQPVGSCTFLNVSGSELELSVPRALLGISPGDFELEFKWSDNMQQQDVMDFYVNGEASPPGRFNYLYKTK